MTRPDMFLRLSQQLGALLSRGWSLTWRAVRRRLNEAADELATRGVFWAAQLPAAAADAAHLTHWPAAFGDDPAAAGLVPADALGEGYASSGDPDSD